MSHIRSTRGGFDNYSYWIAFIVIASFVAYFLSSMIRLSAREDNKYNTATLESYQEQNIMVKSHRDATGVTSVDATGNVNGIE